MSLHTQIKQEMQSAMKARAELRLSVLAWLGQRFYE